MPSFRSSKDQAAHAVSTKNAVGTSRHDNKADGNIHSIRSVGAYEQSLKQFGDFLVENRLGDLKNTTAEIAQAYLLERQEAMLSQKTIDLDRQALQCHLGQHLERVQSLKETDLGTRSYTNEQIKEVASHQSERNALATEIAHAAGLRAHELATIRPSSERQPSAHRQWSENRFAGRDGVSYTVKGKGGLVREVQIPRALAVRLEARRIEGGPVRVTDRGVHYQKHYDIGSGKNWSSSFSRVSTNNLGWSNGAHGLRHSYAQERMSELQGAGMSYKQALGTVAQELGHFSPHTTEAYLR